MILTTSSHMAILILIRQKSQKIIKIVIFHKNSIFDIVADIDRNDDIKQKGKQGGLLVFGTFSKIFFQKSRFLWFFGIFGVSK